MPQNSAVLEAQKTACTAVEVQEKSPQKKSRVAQILYFASMSAKEHIRTLIAVPRSTSHEEKNAFLYHRNNARAGQRSNRHETLHKTKL